MPALRLRPPRRIRRDTVALPLPGGGQTMLLRVRDPRARRLRLIVDERGVRLTLPHGASLRQAEAFVRQHVDWLALQVRRHALGPAPAFGPDHPGPLPLRGLDWPLHWRSGRYARVERVRGRIVAQLPDGADSEAAPQALHEFYLAEARADIGRWLPKYLPGLPGAPTALRIRPLSSLWGSLSPGNALSLDLALVLAPSPVFEYVLVHELCHLIRRDHSRAFWRAVEARFPEWRAQRDWFAFHGPTLKARLRRLLGLPTGWA